MRRITAALALLLLASSSAFAQLQGGAVTGVVVDQTDAVLPGATAELTGPDTRRMIVTDASGAFHFLDIAPGTYRLEIGRAHV